MDVHQVSMHAAQQLAECGNLIASFILFFFGFVDEQVSGI